jgi:hypothetical protein
VGVYKCGERADRSSSTPFVDEARALRLGSAEGSAANVAAIPNGARCGSADTSLGLALALGFGSADATASLQHMRATQLATPNAPRQSVEDGVGIHCGRHE